MAKRLPMFALQILLSLASLSPASPMQLAILNFDNLTQQPEYDYLSSAIPQLLITDLKPSKQIQLIERSQLEKILQEMQLGQTGAIDEQTAIKVGQMTGADHLLLGTIFLSDDQLRFDARVIETSSSKINLAEKVTTPANSDLVDAIDKLGRLILHGLTNEILPAAPPDPGIFQPLAGEALAIYAALDNARRISGSIDPSYLLVDIKAGKMTRGQERIPLNICMVIDRSGSMEQENKLENVKKAAMFVVDHLEKDDYFSLVAYDTQVSTPVPVAHPSDRESLKSIISTLSPGSSTNLSGGLMEGYTQVRTHYRPGMVNRVLLLSDGLANTGITDPTQLQKIATSKNLQGMTLSCFGVGSDFNEDLMTNLAEFGGGNYYFIHNPDDIPAIFSQELFGLLSVVAQNVKIRLRLSPGITCLQTFGYSSIQSGDEIEVKLNDIFSEEEKSVIFKLGVPAAGAGLMVGEVIVTYDDVAIKNERLTKTIKPSLIYTADRALVALGRNRRVAENVILYESARMLEEAIVHVDKRDYQKAQEINAQNLTFLQNQVSNNSPRRIKQQMLDVMKYQNESKKVETMNENERKVLQKGAKYENYIQQKKK